MRRWPAISILALVLTVLTISGAAADRYVGGTVAATLNSEPGPTWKYTVTIDWDTDAPSDDAPEYTVNGFALILDEADGMCTCQDFHNALSVGDYHIGSSDGLGGCTAVYYGEISCGSSRTLLLFSPRAFCQPAVAGQGIFIFYSDLPPTPIDESILSVIAYHWDGTKFYGYLSGDFPLMPCDLVGTEAKSWGFVKGIYR